MPANGTSANMASEAQESKGIANTQIHAYKPQSWPIFQMPLWLVRCRHLKVVKFCCKIKFLLSGVTTHPPPASHRSTKIHRSQDHFPFYKNIHTIGQDTDTQTKVNTLDTKLSFFSWLITSWNFDVVTSAKS